jgi:hypothetical protein
MGVLRHRAFAMLACAAAAAAVCLFPAARLAGAQQAGRTVETRGQVQGTPPGAGEVPLAPGDGLVLDHLIVTRTAAAARLAVLRGGSISMGQETQLRLDQERIDAATGQSQSTFSLLLGRLELALGRLFQGELTIETPTATLGLRGTLVRVLVDENGRTVVAVLEGVVEFTSLAGGAVDVEPGFFSVVDPGAPPTPPAPFDLGGAGISAGTRSPDFVVPGADGLVDSPFPGRLVDIPPGQFDPTGPLR